jgi:hypothetical protein
MPWLPGTTTAAAAGWGVGTAVSGAGWKEEGASGVKDARFGTGYAWNNAWPMSGSSSSSSGGGGDGSGAALDAQGHFEMIVAAAAAGRDSAALQQMLAVLVRQLPAAQAQLALDVLGGGVSDAAFAAATATLQQRKDHTAAGAAADAFDGQVVWQLGQSDAAAADNTADAAAATAAVARWGAEDQDDSAAAAAAAGFAADQVLVREVVRLVEAIPTAVPAGSLPMDAMQVSLASASAVCVHHMYIYSRWAD